jgi:ubiquinone/menaquinone biosynthesis C-methylase UbiE
MYKTKSGSHLLSTANSTGKYYKSLNHTYLHLFGKYLMLHYPFYKAEDESLEERQINLTDYCLSQAPELANKTLLEVGCGNGIQTLYIAQNQPESNIIGIDLNQDNIFLALQNKNGQPNIEFKVDDAHQLGTIHDNSIDLLICIESAFHYPQKELFLQQIKRVLKPSGKFIIADIINKSPGRKYLSSRWKSKMSFYHWTEQKYIESIDSSRLKIDHAEIITDSVIKGYQGSRNWINRKNCGSMVSYIWFKIFSIIQLGINIHLLKKKEDYFLITGSHKS